MSEPDIHEAAVAHVNRAWDWFSGMVALSATNLGVQLGLFDALRAGPRTPAELAAELRLQPHPVDLWAKTLLHYELLTDAGEGRVAMSPGLDLMVCEPVTLFNLAPSLEYHARFLARDFLDLPRFFRDGVPQPPARHGPDLSANVSRQTALMHAVFVQAIVPDLPEVYGRLLEGCRVLDAGCGNGHLGVLLCSAFPGVRYVGCDLDDDALSAGRDLAAEAGLAGRIELSHGDLSVAPEPAAFDLALLFLTLHEVGPEARPSLAASIRSALRPGGILVVLDETYPETLSEAALRSSRMGLHFEYSELLWGSHVPTRTELADLLAGAGFSGIERLPMLDGSLELVVARTE